VEEAALEPLPVDIMDPIRIQTGEASTLSITTKIVGDLQMLTAEAPSTSEVVCDHAMTLFIRNRGKFDLQSHRITNHTSGSTQREVSSVSGVLKRIADTLNRWTIDTRIIQADLKVELPIWPFSCYAPRSDAPRQLIEGKLEISAEEMRLEAYKLAKEGKQAEVV
jgi:hypothetical protein